MAKKNKYEYAIEMNCTRDLNGMYFGQIVKRKYGLFYSKFAGVEYSDWFLSVSDGIKTLHEYVNDHGLIGLTKDN